SLDQVIAQAGGLEREADPRYAKIQKGEKSLLIDLDQYRNRGEGGRQIAGWFGGETIFFQKEMGDPGEGGRLSNSAYRLPIYMLGEVRKPGEYPVRAGY